MSEKMTEAQMLAFGYAPRKNNTTMKELSKEQIDALNRRLPKVALKAKPGAAGFTSINAMYVVDRLNEVFGVGGWSTQADYITMLEETARNKNGEYTRRMPIVKVTFDVPEYNIHYECFGGNDNSDLGDAFKGATTDALTKIGSWLGIGAGIWRGEYDHRTPEQAQAPMEETKADNDKATIALSFMAANQKALEFYCEKFNVKFIDELTNKQLAQVYDNLKQLKKL